MPTKCRVTCVNQSEGEKKTKHNLTWVSDTFTVAELPCTRNYMALISVSLNVPYCWL